MGATYVAMQNRRSLKIAMNLSRIAKLVTVISGMMLVACGPISHTTAKTPEVCKKVFQPNRIASELPPDLSMEDVIAVEKCGFQYHPHVSFSERIVFGHEYPIRALLNELGRIDDDWWSVYLVQLIKDVMEKDKFHAEVMRDRKLIMKDVCLAFDHVIRERPREEMQGLRDGIEIYYMEQDGAVF